MGMMLNCLLALGAAIGLGVFLWDASDGDMFGGARLLPALVQRALAALVRVIDALM